MRKPDDRWLAPSPCRRIGRPSRHSGQSRRTVLGARHLSQAIAPASKQRSTPGTDVRPRCRGGRYAGRSMMRAAGQAGASQPLALWLMELQPRPNRHWRTALGRTLASALGNIAGQCPFYPFYPWLRQRDCATTGGIEKPRGRQDRSPQSEGSHARFASLHFQPGEDSRLPPGYCGQSRAAHRPFAQALGRQRSGRTSPTDGDERWRR